MRRRNSARSASGTPTVNGRIAFLPPAAPSWVVPVVVIVYSFERFGFRVRESGLERVGTLGGVANWPAALVAALRLRRTEASRTTFKSASVLACNAGGARDLSRYESHYVHVPRIHRL